MRVVLAEKPSVARDLAKVLGATTRRDGYLEGNDLKVTWAIGHLVQLKTPDEYDPALKRWSLAHLPFIPTRFELRPSGDAGIQRQLAIVCDLLRAADDLVCATDAGREGELIFRYLLEYAGIPDKPHTRLWLSSLTEEAIRDALQKAKPGTAYQNMRDAAQCRSEADWIVGLNATRAYTVGYGGGAVLWSLGRVQTPVLAMIAARDDEIRTFDPRPFWELRTRYRRVRFRHAGERSRTAAAAADLLQRVTDQPFVIDRRERRTEALPPPLLYDLTQLQRDLNQRHGLSAARTLQLAQELYEQKLLTYPRTDSRHLPLDMVEPVRSTLAALRAWRPAALAVLAAHVAADPEHRGPRARSKRIFDDQKVSDHHAIVPTGRQAELTGEHQLVYDAVALRLVTAFLGDRVQDVTTVFGSSAGVPFRARGVVITDPGWTALEAPPTEPAKRKPGRGKAKTADDDDSEDDSQELPEFQDGEQGPHQPELHEGKTKPPRPFTESSLLQAMETCGKDVTDENLRQALRGRGLGTPATRAAIVETLLQRAYLRREQKALRITDLGRYLIGIVADPLLKSPELTGEWEWRLGEIERGRASRIDFVTAIVEQIQTLVHEGLHPPIDPTGCGHCPRCRAPAIEGQHAYGCSRWREGCDFRLPKVYRNVPLTRRQVAELLDRGLLQAPLRLADGPRILCRTAAGVPFDLEPPSREAQRRPAAPPARPAATRRPKPRRERPADG